MLWQVTSFPRCRHHAFLSHCQEDRAALVLPVYEQLVSRGIIPWLDQEDYYYGRSSRNALRDGVLRSRHVVFFVTHAMLTSARGWCVLELALAELMEDNFQVRGGQLAHVILPLFLVPQTDERLPRTVWQLLRDRGRFHEGVGDQVTWCVEAIVAFLIREQELSREAGLLARVNPDLVVSPNPAPGLLDRVIRYHPRKIQP